MHCSLPHRAISVNQLLYGPRNSVRRFFPVATMDCFTRSNVTLLLCLSKVESSPLLQKLTRILTTPDAAILFFGFYPLLLTDLTLSSKFARDSVQRIAGSWYAIGLQVSPKYSWASDSSPVVFIFFSQSSSCCATRAAREREV